MATAQMDTVIRHLRRTLLRQDGAGWTDGQLLASFIDQKDEAAFEVLVRRHGPMVFGVCRRVVGSLAAVVWHNLASAGAPTSLMISTVKAATMIAAGKATVAGVVPAKVAILTEGVLKAMLLSKLKTSTVGLLLVALLIGAAGAIYETQATQPPQEEQKTKTTGDASTSLPDKSGPKKDQTPKKNLEGVWAVISVKDNDKKTLDSEPIFSHAAGTQAPIRNARLTLQGETFILRTGLVSLEGTYTFDPAVTPKEITLSITDSGGLLSIPGVYSLDGDKLTITFGRLPASLLAGLAGKEPGVCYTLQREPLPKKDADNPK
jgi:uncharacterized protein (TIGR03067 family)